jgi:hypothetical protein
MSCVMTEVSSGKSKRLSFGTTAETDARPRSRAAARLSDDRLAVAEILVEALRSKPGG